MSEKDARARAQERRETGGTATAVEPERGTAPDQGIDRAIAQMERLYSAVTGREAPPPQSVYAPIPAERDPGEHLDHQMDRLLRLLEERGTTDLPMPAWSPPASVWESESEIVVRLDVPGIAREQVEVSFEDGALQVRGYRPPPTEPGLRLKLSEAPIGRFQRTLLLASVGRTGEPTAALKEGVLEVRIPRTETPSRTRRSIAIT